MPSGRGPARHGNWLEERDDPPVDRLVAQQDERHLGPVRSRVFDPWATTNHVVHSSLASLTPHAAYDFQRSQAAPSDGYSRERGTRGEWMRDEGHPRAEEWRTSTTYGNSFRGRPSTAPRRYDRHKARWKPEPLDVAPEGRPWVGRRTLSTSLSSTRLMAEMENDNPWQTTNAISFSGALPALVGAYIRVRTPLAPAAPASSPATDRGSRWTVLCPPAAAEHWARDGHRTALRPHARLHVLPAAGRRALPRWPLLTETEAAGLRGQSRVSRETLAGFRVGDCWEPRGDRNKTKASGQWTPSPLEVRLCRNAVCSWHCHIGAPVQARAVAPEEPSVLAVAPSCACGRLCHDTAAGAACSLTSNRRPGTLRAPQTTL